MTALQNFAFEDHLVRVVERDDEPWFVGKDVCEALAIKNHNDALSTLDDDEKGVATTDPLSRGGPQEMIVVSEPGVYRLVFRSRKAEAERFKRWLAHDVLPALRRTGRYAVAVDTHEPAALAERRMQLDMIKEARITFGPRRAAALWKTLGLPEVPQAPTVAQLGVAEAVQCLNHLLDYPCDTGVPIRQLIENALEDNDEARALLKASGVRVTSGFPEVEGFSVASRSRGIVMTYANTPWADFGWTRMLRRLAGARPYKAAKYDQNFTSQGTWLSANWLDPQTAEQLMADIPAH